MRLTQVCITQLFFQYTVWIIKTKHSQKKRLKKALHKNGRKYPFWHHEETSGFCGGFPIKKIYAVDHPIPSNIGSKCFQSRRLKCRSKSYWQEQRWTQSNDNVPQSFTSGGQKLLTLRKSKKKYMYFLEKCILMDLLRSNRS